MQKVFPLISSLLVPGFALQFEAALASENCPKQFFEIQLPEKSKQCRIFGVKKPATLSFYLDSAPETAFAEFVTQLPDAQQSRNKSMQILLSAQPKVRIYVYPDGTGTQVNIRAE